MTNEAKLEKFKSLLILCTQDQLLDMRDECFSQLESLTRYQAKQTYSYKALLALEEEMVKRGLS
jgi:hypothetical protein